MPGNQTRCQMGILLRVGTRFQYLKALQTMLRCGQTENLGTRAEIRSHPGCTTQSPEGLVLTLHVLNNHPQGWGPGSCNEAEPCGDCIRKLWHEMRLEKALV